MPTVYRSFPGGSVIKNPPATVGNRDLIPDPGRSLEKEMATHLVLLSGDPHGQRSLAGYSPWDHKELDTT